MNEDLEKRWDHRTVLLTTDGPLSKPVPAVKLEAW
jgi:hypothetical protein